MKKSQKKAIDENTRRRLLGMLARWGKTTPGAYGPTLADKKDQPKFIQEIMKTVGIS